MQPRRTPTGPRRIVSRHERAETREVELAVREVLARAEALALGLPEPEEDPEGPPLGFDALERELGQVIERATGELRAADTPRPRVAELIEFVLAAEGARSRLRERRVTERLEVFAAVRESLAALSSVDDVDTLLARAPEAICRGCGFERSVLSRVEGSEWTIENAYFDGDDEWAAQFVSFGQAAGRGQLNHLLLETEMLRRRAPAVVHDAQTHPMTHRPLVEHADVRDYVSAPIMPKGQVVGFVHGDYYYSERDVDTLDRDALWAFAQGFALLFERASLIARLKAQRDQVRQLLTSADAVMTELSESELQFQRKEGGDGELAQNVALFLPSESRLEALLTRRQLEILSLMAAGATNSDIAGRLTIAEGTVKTHVKHILRKLRAANRAEAVAKYFRMSIDNGTR